MMHPAADPTDAAALMMAPLPMGANGYECGSMPIAFGDLPPDFELTGFDGVDGLLAFDGDFQGMPYDPNSGMYMPYDWSMMQFSPDYNMMGGMGMEGALDEFGNCIPMMPQGNNAEQLLAALSEKLAADKGTGFQPGLSGDYIEGAPVLPDYTEGVIVPLAEVLGGGALGMGGELAENEWNAMDMQGHQLGSDRGAGGRKIRNRERGGRGQDSPQHSKESEYEAPHNQQAPVNFTTVMFRNIPNKYTREMLVKQLEQDLKGHFDFVYLPIDFKNQCNVGYAFINFRSTEACDIFMQNFNGVEVRKCLPGLNSRKVTEVTPARVQGFEDNVQRLRNSPVMRELAHHPEWMPLIFDANGIQFNFPQPERTLEPIKPRRRAREEVAAGAGA